jgi:hypothetical protein
MSEVKRYIATYLPYENWTFQCSEEDGVDNGLIRSEDSRYEFVLASDYDALTARLAEALSHEGEKDAQIEQLLTYLHYSEETESHRDWVADCQDYEVRIVQLEAALRKYGSHYEDCAGGYQRQVCNCGWSDVLTALMSITGTDQAARIMELTDELARRDRQLKESVDHEVEYERRIAQLEAGLEKYGSRAACVPKEPK